MTIAGESRLHHAAFPKAMNAFLLTLILFVAAILGALWIGLAYVMFHDTADRDPYHRL